VTFFNILIARYSTDETGFTSFGTVIFSPLKGNVLFKDNNTLSVYQSSKKREGESLLENQFIYQE
jgi:hypothetical protein